MRVRAVLFSVGVLLAMLVVSAAQRTREGITSPRVLDGTLAPRPHEFWSLLCSEIPPVPCTALAPGRGRGHRWMKGWVATMLPTATLPVKEAGSVSIPTSL